jgi:replicative DNA helicase
MSDRLINSAAEGALLGAMMLKNDIITEWAGRLRVEDFGDPLHGRMFAAMMRFSAKGIEVNAMTLRPVFQNDEAAQYGEYLDTLVDSPAAIVGADSFALQIIDFAARRSAREAMHTGMEALATDFDRPIAEITGGIEEAVWAAETRTEVTKKLSLGDLAGLVEDRDERINADPGAAGLQNVLVPDIDRALGPPEGKMVVIIAGRPGMGKTALATSIAIGYALAGEYGSFYSLEMSDEQSALRMTSDLSHAMGLPLEHAKLKKGGLSPDERFKLRQIAEQAAHMPLEFVPMKSGTDIMRIWAEAARRKALLAAKGVKLKFIMIDQLTLCGATNADGKPIELDFPRANAISSTVRRMADDLDVTVFALTQVGRSADQRANRRPTMSDLKGSGKFEEDADGIILIYREEEVLREEEPKRIASDPKSMEAWEKWETDMRIVEGTAELIVGKSRNTLRKTRVVKYLGKHFAVRSTDVPLVDDPFLL